jgi:hypothetical protein
MATKIIVAALEQDAKALTKLVRSINTTSATYHINLQSAAVSVLFHAAKNGRVEDLQALYTGMKPAYQSAYRQYIHKHCGKMVAFGDGKQWDGYLSLDKSGTFKIVNKRQESRDAFIAKAQQLVEGKPFFNSDPAVSKPVFTLDDKAILSRLDKLIKDASKKDSKVSLELVNRLRLARVASENIVNPKPETKAEEKITTEVIEAVKSGKASNARRARKAA